MWPNGLSKEHLAGKTRALPAIWAEGSTIGAKAKA
jgi:hypothetical protein